MSKPTTKGSSRQVRAMRDRWVLRGVCMVASCGRPPWPACHQYASESGPHPVKDGFWKQILAISVLIEPLSVFFKTVKNQSWLQVEAQEFERTQFQGKRSRGRV